MVQPKRLTPGCLLFDGCWLEQNLASRRPDVPIICLAGQSDVASVVRIMKAGAIDVLTKPICVEALLATVRHAFDLSAAAVQRGVEEHQLEARFASLSPRERQVMELVVHGLLNKQIGGELGITEITVKAHRGRMMRKMDAPSVASLVKMAARLPISSPAGFAGAPCMGHRPLSTCRQPR